MPQLPRAPTAQVVAPAVAIKQEPLPSPPAVPVKTIPQPSPFAVVKRESLESPPFVAGPSSPESVIKDSKSLGSEYHKIYGADSCSVYTILQCMPFIYTAAQQETICKRRFPPQTPTPTNLTPLPEATTLENPSFICFRSLLFVPSPVPSVACAPATAIHPTWSSDNDSSAWVAKCFKQDPDC